MDADAKTSSNPSDDEATVASLLRGYRLAAGLSQAELAERASISVAAIASLEQGLRKSPHQFTLNNIADALDLTRAERTKFEEARTRAHARRVQAQQVALESNLPDELLLNNLPPELTSFVDRENDVPEIKLLLQSHRLVTVIGAGGAGKTRCALRVAGEMLDDFVDGTWFVELAHISDPALVATTVAKALKLQEVPNRSALETLLAYLKRKHSLLFLDNCEHVITEVGHLVACALRDCPHVRILATSRESFAIAGERAYRLPSLPVPNVSELESLQQLLQYGSVRLFGDRAASADDRFTLTMETAPHVAYICRRLDGIPLAIELAAARVNVLSARTLARKLDERFLMLTGGDRNALPRHQTMRALIDWSYDLLSDLERRLFRGLSIFAGGFTLETAVAVCGDDATDEITIVDVLSSLVNKSLLQVDMTGNEERYQFLETTRQYARERLRSAGEEEMVARAHACAFLDLAQQLSDAWEIPPECEWNARSEPELDNFRAALSWAFGERGDALLGLRLVVAMRRVWYKFGPTEGLRWLRTAHQRATADTPAAVMATLYLAECGSAVLLDRYASSIQPAEEALARYRDLGDPYGTALTESLLGTALVFVGKIAEGEPLLERSLEALRALNVCKTITMGLGLSGYARMHVGDFPGARQRFREALPVAQAFGGDIYAFVARNLAELEFRDGHAELALQLAREALADSAASRDTFLIASVRRNMAAYLVALHRFDEARAAAREAVMAAWNMQFSMGLASTLQHVAAVAALRPSDDGRVAEDRRHAALILGYVDAQVVALETAREYTDQQEYNAIISALRDAFGEDDLMRLMAVGSACSEDQAVAEAMLV